MKTSWVAKTKVELDIEVSKQLITRYLQPLYFNKEELSSLVHNILLAEMGGQYAHGLARACWIKENVIEKKIHSFNKKQRLRITQKENILIVDAKMRLGTYVFSRVIRKGMLIANKHGGAIGIITQIGPYSGFIGAYAYEVMKSGYVFLAMVDSPKGVTPYQADRELWGTDTITFGFPDEKNPILVDLTFAEKTLGEQYLEKLLRIHKGKRTEISPIAKHKGSSLILMVKILAGTMGRFQKLKKDERTSGVFFLLIKKNCLPKENYSKQMLEEILEQMKTNSKGKTRFPGSETLRKIKEAKLKGTINTYKAVYEKILTEKEVYG